MENNLDISKIKEFNTTKTVSEKVREDIIPLWNLKCKNIK
jgi:hypothetical protein